MEMGLRSCFVQKVPYFIRNPTPLDLESFHQSTWNTTRLGLTIGGQKLTQCRVSFGNPLTKHISRRARRVSVSVKESSSAESENDYAAKEPVAKTLSGDELKAWSADIGRAALLRKLSEANQQNRFLKRQLHIREKALVDFKRELADMELGIQASVKLSEEIANSSIPEGTRKINGKYIQSHLLSRLEGVLNKLRAQIKGVAVAQSKEVHVSWYGMAESVQVMGTFDGWSQGEHLSPEYMGTCNKFSATLLLRPGRYEIKFLVDGEWKLSPEFPSVGEGLTENNLLVVE